ncbi:nickel transporter [Helicobacter winghamensis]|uniref:DUF4198 domain-containing protein n=1 Tax=Helicobacter winghamensis TaxID=157268 RepID=UPI0001A28BEE|nr:DUF4198 domain-containing protein [Helicobacter winghamensis]EEO26771.1 hypothetical protein HWAG_01563 [Helicobacter winghamensis ATCC BAA-430]PKT79121.1 nickel transporter [Helicobacter winghamensis]PKT79273.1 nickel transporter [Helicobacter winghamensis]
MKKTILSLMLGVSLFASSAMAHFQMVYLPESALSKQTKEKLSLVFTHPFADEHTMDMESVNAFYVINPKGQKENLKNSLKPITWKGNTNSGKGYEITYNFKRLEDYIFVLEPAPYFEKNEDSYIQQFTKVIANLAGAPTGWDRDLGLEAEIIPLTKPYAIWEGSTFTGIVKSNGKPVPYAEIEVEFLNYEVNQTNNAFGKTPKLNAPQDSFVTIGIKANKDGEFTFGIPKAGWWGFAALGIGPKSKFKGKELSQDAVIWVQAKPLQ